MLWETHKYTPLVNCLFDATLFQKQFFFLMAVGDVNYRETLDVRLKGIAKGVGVEFKKK